MQAILTRCGYRCDLCLAYRPNIEAHPPNRQALSDGWYKYFGFRIPPEQINCDGCLADDPHLIDTACRVRPCVMERGYTHCAECLNYVCEKLAERLVVYEDIAARLGCPIPEEDREKFILPGC